ncbi:hypothetical protein RUM44_003599 [Polyplax serrata]|uniref:Uncharacterized protein n=1 Tax=Polyplax serrata TaxID=468196 RepID=A0ABR1AGY0_POLSC
MRHYDKSKLDQLIIEISTSQSAPIENHPAEGSLLKFNRASAPPLREEQPLELEKQLSKADKTTIPAQLQKIQQ